MNMRPCVELLSVVVVCLALLFLAAEVTANEEDEERVRPASAYVWKTGKWGSCFSSVGCGEGEQQRSIWCAHVDGRTTLEFLCDAQDRPPRTRNCFRVCEEHSGHIAWRVGVWEPCLPVESDMADVFVSSNTACSDRRGAMTRDVTCIYRRHRNDHPKVVEDEACEYFKPKPRSRLGCQVPCSQDCIVNPFKSWLPCVGCGSGNRARVRDVLVAPQHGGRQCPSLSETETCNEAVACLQGPHRSREYRLWIGEWGPCSPLESPTAETSSPYAFRAIFGQQTRNIKCKDPAGYAVDESYCVKGDKAGLPPKVQACIVPSDCIVSSWSNWKVIADGCITSNNDIRPELRKRTRHVLQLPLGGGKPCPHLEELHRVTEKSQLPSCTKYKWIQSEWSECILTNHSTVTKVTCGGGIQLRRLICLRSDDLVPVPHYYCSEVPPPTVQRCSVPCKQNCVVLAWTAWEPCRPSDCRDLTHSSRSGYRERYRKVLQHPSNDGEPCPPIRQVDSCDQPSCFYWKTTDFELCVVLNKELRCGQGRQTRKAYCVDSEGVRVDDGLCAIYIPPPETSVPCYIPCPSDCVLSKWAGWSPCTRLCVERDDRGVRVRNRTVLAPAGLGGTPCPNSDELTENEFCNQHSCFGFGWKSLAWQPCKPTNPLETCGPGEQVRDVLCLKDKDRKVSDKKCVPIPKPEDRRPCTIQCLKECITTEYTDWTVCPDACHLAPASVTTQKREMFVLQWPQPGKEPCPEALQEVRTCPVLCEDESNEYESSPRSYSGEQRNSTACAKPCYTYQWSLGEWGPCKLPDLVDCGIGFRTRSVVCQRNVEKEVEADLCLAGPSKTLPVISERCHLSCTQMCALSEWSEWSQCPQNCGGIQTRTRQILEEHYDKEECHNSQQYPTKEQRNCPCHVYSSRPEGSWSDCILDDSDEMIPINGRPVSGRCGVGKRFRKVACYDKNSNLVDPLLCTPTGYEEDACMLPCPVDCQMSPWSEWSPCSALCGSGFRERYRSILREDFDGGRSCPKTDPNKMEKEAKACFVPCEQYKWYPHGWTQCELSPMDFVHQCGTGIQNRKVTCMRIDNITRPETVKDEYCDQKLKPDSMNYCHVPCPTDCVVSDWSEWSQCSQPCDAKHTRMRERQMVREPFESGNACPVSSEVEPCILNENCFHYTWNATEWSSCIIHENATCGEGVKQRNIVCLRSEGRIVEDGLCEQTGSPRPETSEIWCSVDCPVDCEVSDWSDWSYSECGVCGESGHAVRTRQILVHPGDTGRPCPTALVQRKPCQARPCYHWVRTQFDTCELEGSACGHGASRREVACQRVDGATVEKHFCLESNSTGRSSGVMDQRWLESLLDIHTEEPCHIACPGDCVLSIWSEWSACHRDCAAGEQGGYQTRSRAVLANPSANGERCPEQLWMTRPCFDGPCYQYQWKIRDDAVVCIRSDGIIVQGGCHGRPRPCLPPCRLAHSECSRHGACMCETGFRPQFREAPSGAIARELIGCELMQSTNSSHHTGGGVGGEIKVMYLPKDNEVSFWMYAMISVGSAFIIFVAVTVYLMCHSSVRQADSPTRRSALAVRRPLTGDDGKP